MSKTQGLLEVEPAARGPGPRRQDLLELEPAGRKAAQPRPVLPKAPGQRPAAGGAEGPEAAAAPKWRREKAGPRWAAHLRRSPSYRVIPLGPRVGTGGRRPKIAAAPAPAWVGVGTPGPGGGSRVAEEDGTCPPEDHPVAREAHAPRRSVCAGAGGAALLLFSCRLEYSSDRCGDGLNQGDWDRNAYRGLDRLRPDQWRLRPFGVPPDLGIETGQRAVTGCEAHAAPVPKFEGAQEQHPDRPDGTQ